MDGSGGIEPTLREIAIRTHHERAEWSDAVTAGLREYGPEIFGFLVATSGSEDQAADIFSQFSLDLWQGVRKFRWQSSFRTWAYTLARHAWLRVGQKAQRRRERPLSECSKLSEIEQQIRSETAPFLKSEIKSRAADLRRRLLPDDQALLILRIDKQLSWEAVAQILSAEALDQDAARRAQAALRKRFERVKTELRQLARAEGLLE
jgi:RNA polymerase sigma-70 factor (ECF subfamily)